MVFVSNGSRAMVQGRTRWLMIGSLLAAGTILAHGCAEERGLSPIPESFRLYVGCQGDRTAVHAFDTGTDSLVDSTDAIIGRSAVRASADGLVFIRYVNPACPEVWDARSFARIGSLPECAPIPRFAVRDHLIIGTRKGKVDYISYPDLTFLGSDSLLTDDGQLMGVVSVDDARGVMYCGMSTGPDSLRWGRVGLWSYRERRLVKIWDIRSALGPESWGFSFSIVPGTDHALVQTTRAGGAWLLRVDLETGSVLWEFLMWSSQATVRVSPDHRELWRGHFSTLDPSPVPYIYVHDATTGTVIDTVPLPDLPPPLIGYPLVMDIAFTPDGHKVYVAAGYCCVSTFYLQPVYVIDRRARSTIGSLLDDGEHVPSQLDICPAL